MCGTLEDEWMDEDGRYLDPPVLEPITYTCHGCEARESLEAARREAPDETRRGERIIVVPFDADRDVEGVADRPYAEHQQGYQPPVQNLDSLPAY